MKPSQRTQLLHLYRRRVAPDEVVSPELARAMCELSWDIGRQVGVFVDRRGAITHVLLGDAERIQLPDLGRGRAGKPRLRGIRLLHTHVGGEALSRDDLTDLVLLRLDGVCAMRVGDAGLPGLVEWAMLEPSPLFGAPPHRVDGPMRVHDLPADLRARIEAIEGEAAASAGVRETAGRPRALLVGVEEPGERSADRRLAELARLAETAGLEPIDTVVQRRAQVDPRTIVGEGKMQELLVRAMQLRADMLVFDRELSPSQGKGIAERTELKVIDRSQLILDIFAQHANSRDGRVQVELAQLRYLLPRLAKMQQSLSRLTGGVGGRGPGETKLEVRSRRAHDRIALLSRRLDKLSQQRALRRADRRERGVPTAAFVGYTNAGKSTLLNAMTGATVAAADQLFATLDPTTRRLRSPNAREIVLTDTVGFIEELPPDLLRAFSATLEELHDTHVLIHVIDGADPDAALHLRVVDEVISSLGLSATSLLRVVNKVDIAPEEALVALRDRLPDAVLVSARTGAGLHALTARIDAALASQGFRDLLPAFRRGDALWHDEPLEDDE